MTATVRDDITNFANPLSGLDDAAYAALEQIMVHKKLKRKEYFLKQGQVCKQLGLINKGSVRLFYLVDGEEITKDFNFENFICGSYASFSLQQPSRFNIVAMEDLDLYLLGRDQLYHLMEKNPSIQKLARLQLERMFIRKEMRESSFLLDTAEQRYQNVLDNEPEMASRVPLKYLASYLGMSAETLSRIRRSAAGK